ncbi:hypothetical protein GGR53DRAFT_466444 [Hypoxylon sp. FL1150]|nr:hypothetical protein GGR53DRAFT_466444 [Hypoxylon sp. FL1150]
MPQLDVDSQFKFLIVCIKHSTSGKVDFLEVAKECEIVSKGAAAKRYERLMKAHGITLGGGTGAKKEPKDTKEGVKGRASKKRKLAAVDEDAGDVDEPVKTEVKGEVKTEDLIGVKAEQENGGVATIPSVAVPANGSEPSVQPPNATSPSATTAAAAAANNEDDDEIQVISATERRGEDGSGGSSGASVYGSIGDHHHHHHSHSHSHSHPMIPGIHSFDYAANMGYPQTTRASMTTPPTATMATPNSLPYGFPAGPWMFHHDASHGYL